MSRSNAEAKLRALAATTSEIVWLWWLLADLGVSCDGPTSLYCDSTAAIQIANDPMKHELTKHIGVDASFTHFSLPTVNDSSSLCSFRTSSCRLLH